MILATAVWLTASALFAPAETASTPKPLVQLIQDLDAALPRAHVTEAQREQLGSDRTVLDGARLARERGGAVDRRQVAGAVKSIHTVLESGVFLPQDAHAIEADIDVLRSRSK